MNRDIKIIKDSYQAYLTTLDMLKERKYSIIEDKILSLDIFSKKFDESSPLNFIFEDKENNKICLQILKEIKIPKKELISKVEEIKKEYNLINYLFLTQDNQNINLKHEINLKYNIDLELFSIENLQINILKHELQPNKFILFTNEEKVELLEKNNWEEDNLPKIKITDPIARYYNAKIGQIFKIIRTSMVGRNKTSSQGIYYRIVTE